MCLNTNDCGGPGITYHCHTQVKKVREYMKDPKFTVDDIRSISTAGAGLLKWVFAMVNYYRCITELVQVCCLLRCNSKLTLLQCQCHSLVFSSLDPGGLSQCLTDIHIAC